MRKTRKIEVEEFVFSDENKREIDKIIPKIKAEVICNGYQSFSEYYCNYDDDDYDYDSDDDYDYDSDDDDYDYDSNDDNKIYIVDFLAKRGVKFCEEESNIIVSYDDTTDEYSDESFENTNEIFRYVEKKVNNCEIDSQFLNEYLLNLNKEEFEKVIGNALENADKLDITARIIQWVSKCPNEIKISFFKAITTKAE